jgi:hypothetical protein
VRLPASKDSRLLVAGVAAMVALVAYLAVAFANVHASIVAANHVAPWTPYHATLIPVSRGKGRGYDVRVNPTKTGGYGGLIPTLVSGPASGGRYAVRLWLKGSSRGGPVGVEIDEFSPGAQSVYVVDTTVSVTPRWRHFTFKFRVKGTWLGLGMYVHRQNSGGAKTWFALRNLTAALS